MCAADNFLFVLLIFFVVPVEAVLTVSFLDFSDSPLATKVVSNFDFFSMISSFFISSFNFSILISKFLAKAKLIASFKDISILRELILGVRVGLLGRLLFVEYFVG